MKSNENQNQTDSGKQDQNTAGSPKKRRRFKRVVLYTLAGLAFLFLVVLPILLNIYADRIIGRTLTEIVKSETGGRYELGFRNVSLNVFSRDIGFEGVVLRPDSSFRASDTAGLITVEVPKLHLKGASWLRSMWQRELIISEIAMHEPVVNYTEKISFPDTTDTPQEFSHPNLYSHIERYLDLLTIEFLIIDKGSFAIDFYNNGIEEKLEVHDFTLQVDHFYLDSVSHQNKNRLFFSDSLGLQLDDGHFFYQKGPLNVSFAHLDISTVSDVLSIKSIYLEQEQDSVNVLELQIPALTIHGMDLKEILQQGKLSLEEIDFQQPSIVYNPHHHQASEKTSADSLSAKIYATVTRQFESVEVGRVSFKNTGLTIPGKALKGVGNIEMPDFDLTLIHLLIDSATRNKRSDFLFLDDFTLISHGQHLSFDGAGLDVSYDKLSMNSVLSRIRLTNLVVEQTQTKPGEIFRAEVPEVRVLGRNFKSDYLSGSVNLQTLELDISKLQWHNIRNTSPGGPDVKNLYPIIGEKLDFVRIDDLEINSENVDLAFGKNPDDAVTADGSINLRLHDFLLDKNSAGRERIFYSEGIEAGASKLDIEWPAAGQSASIDNMFIDTRTSDIAVSGLHVDTLINRNRPISIVLDVAGLKFGGVNFDAIYHGRGYFTDTLMVDQPDIVLIRNRMYPENPNQNRQSTDLLVGHLDISGGSFAYHEPGKRKLPVEVAALELSVDSLLPNGSTPGFTGIEVAMQGISVPLDMHGHTLALSRANISSADSLMIVEDIKYAPAGVPDSDTITVSFDVPVALIRQFPVMDFYDARKLQADKLWVESPRISIIQNVPIVQQNASFHDFDPEIIRTALLKHFSCVNLDSVLITDAEVFSQSISDSATTSLQVDGVRFLVHDFFVDESTVISDSNLMFASDIRLAIDSISRATHNEAKLMLEGFDLKTAAQSLSIDAINYFSFDNLNKNKKTKMKFGSLSTTGLDYYSLFDKKQLQIERLEINRPDLTFDRKSPEQQKISPSPQPVDLYEMIAGHFHEVRADDVVVNDVRMKITEDEHPRKGAYLFEKIDFRLKNILIDSTRKIFGNQFLYSDDMDFTIHDFRETSADSLYDFGASFIRFSSSDASLKVDSGFLHPNYSDSVFAAKVGVQTDRLAFVFDSLKLTNFRLIDFIRNDNLHIDKAELDGLVGDDFRSKAYPFPKNHYPKLPVTGLKSLDFQIRLDTFLVRNSYFKYREYRPPALQPGEIWFTDIDLQGHDITNSSNEIARDSLMRFHASAMLMGEAELSLNLGFNLADSNDRFFVNGILNRFDMTELNPILEHVAFIKVTKGQNEMLDFNFHANNDVAKGEMDFEYKKLHIRLIDKETLTDRGFGESIASFIANTFVVRRKNPKWIFFFRHGDIYFKRDKQKSFFNYLAKSALSGVKSTIRGGNEERKEKRRQRKLER